MTIERLRTIDDEVVAVETVSFVAAIGRHMEKLDLIDPNQRSLLALMRRLDESHLDYPFAGAQMLRALLRRAGVVVGRRHVETLMKRMGISAIYRRPNKSKPAAGHKIYPYLLRGRKIARPNHVWTVDVSYIPMRRGFVYVAAVVDVFSGGCWPIGSQSRWRRRFASKRSRRPWPDMADPRSSTRTRAASSPASSSQAC
ncbi:hypothetical protein MesoLj131a_62720 [Mesorhizobium sp. 131-2-1]|nr:hypothetical protein MesoLj131a_62720 [Mesorhizobium sp. 131-2-1]BCH04479.1 hypothetical protein MesoLj131b_64780 [Mesorhizobium sp. 131-2-5]